MALFNSFFHEFFTDPFFRTSPTSPSTAIATVDGVRRVARLMDTMVLQTATFASASPPTPFPHVKSSAITAAEPARMWRRKPGPVQFLKRPGSIEETGSGKGSNHQTRLAEDEVWRNSLRRGSNGAAPSGLFQHRNNLPAIATPPSTPSDDLHPYSSRKLLPTTLLNQHNPRPLQPSEMLRRKAVASSNKADNNNSGSSTTSSSGGSLKSGSRSGKLMVKNNNSTKAAGANDKSLSRDQLVAKISSQLACERYLVEMIEREVLQRKPNVDWSSIAGLKEAKALLQEVVVLPNIVPDFFKGIRRPWKGVLLVGPPGTGKTLLAKAVATECKSTFFNVTSSTLTSKFRGESEKLVRILFHMARSLAPSIIFIDEVDALVARQNAAHDHEASRRFQAELLIQMDGLQEESNQEGSILVLAASNHPWRVDEAFRRRFEKRIYIPLPDGPAREDMLRLHLKGMKLDSRLNLAKTAKRLEGYSGADILSVCRDAAMMSLRRKIADKSTDQIRQLRKEDLEEPITVQDFADAIKRCKASVSAQDTAAYDNWIREFGSC